ncbi:folate receptor gamma-like [Centruroides vittatus]|uniref:folate receptor gamma-like n=1 Tax=Centruroides vittatus TaxID=120091 RepID=UPI00350FBE14
MSRFTFPLSAGMWLTCVLLLTVCTQTWAQLSRDRDELLNWCLDAKYHKKKPGPESKLYRQCIPWKDRSCCTENTSQEIHRNIYNFDLDHCEQETGHQMSEECRQHFRQDLCFYECEPNIGPWAQKDNKKIRKERFINVPLCSADCDSWWKACKNDYTCVDNWSLKFKFIKGVNHCPNNTKCETFEEVFKTAKNFCEKVWDHSWKYTESGGCMRIWFNGSAGNPNRRVAEVYVDQLLSSSSCNCCSLLLILLLLVLVF